MKPESFDIISESIIKIFRSDLGSKLIKFKDIQTWIITGLQQANNVDYKEMNNLAINVLYNAINSNKDIQYFIVNNNSELLLWSFTLITSKFEESFHSLEKLVIKFSKNELFVRTLFSKNIINALLNIKSVNIGGNNSDDGSKVDRNTIKFRVHCLLIESLMEYSRYVDSNEAKQDEIKCNDINRIDNIVGLYESNGLFNGLIELLTVDDVLLQINILPLFSKIAKIKQGLGLLIRKDIIKMIKKILDDDIDLIGKQAFTVIYNMVDMTKKLYSKRNDNNILKWLNRNEFVGLIKMGINCDDYNVKETSILVLGLFCSFKEILNGIINRQYSISPMIICEYIISMKQDTSSNMKVLGTAALHALANIVSIPTEIDTEMYEYQLNIIKKCGGIKYIYELMKSPEDELRFSAFNFTNEITKQLWGLNIVYKCPGLFEYLSNRDQHDIMLALQWKYAIMESIFRNKNMNKILDKIHKNQLITFIQDGVVFKPNQNRYNKNIKPPPSEFQIGYAQR